MKTKILFLTVLLTICAFTVPQVQARVEKREAAKERVMERKEDRMDKREARTDGRCERLEERIANRITHFDNSHRMHVRQYEKINEKILKAISQAEADGKDVTKIRADLETLNDKIDKFDTDRLALIEALKATQQYACGESEGSFKEALANAQAKQKLVVIAAKDIRNYYQTAIRPDLRALRD